MVYYPFCRDLNNGCGKKAPKKHIMGKRENYRKSRNEDMTDLYLKSGESLVRMARRVSVSFIPFDIMLTTVRLILLDSEQERISPQEIPLSDIFSVKGGKIATGEPVITVTIPDPGNPGSHVPLDLIFTQAEKERRGPERDDWLRTLMQSLVDVRQEKVLSDLSEGDEEGLPGSTARLWVAPEILYPAPRAPDQGAIAEKNSGNNQAGSPAALATGPGRELTDGEEGPEAAAPACGEETCDVRTGPEESHPAPVSMVTEEKEDAGAAVTGGQEDLPSWPGYRAAEGRAEILPEAPEEDGSEPDRSGAGSRAGSPDTPRHSSGKGHPGTEAGIPPYVPPVEWPVIRRSGLTVPEETRNFLPEGPVLHVVHEDEIPAQPEVPAPIREVKWPVLPGPSPEVTQSPPAPPAEIPGDRSTAAEAEQKETVEVKASPATSATGAGLKKDRHVPVPAGAGSQSQTPGPAGRKIALVSAAILVIVIALVAGIAFLPNPPAANATPPPVQATRPVPTVTTVVPAVEPVPQAGLWVSVEYPRFYYGDVGNPDNLREVSGSGNHTYPIPNSAGLVQADIQKQDNSGDTLSLGIYLNGTAVYSTSVRKPMGAVRILIDPRTGKPPV